MVEEREHRCWEQSEYFIPFLNELKFDGSKQYVKYAVEFPMVIELRAELGVIFINNELESNSGNKKQIKTVNTTFLGWGYITQ